MPLRRQQLVISSRRNRVSFDSGYARMGQASSGYGAAARVWGEGATHTAEAVAGQPRRTRPQYCVLGNKTAVVVLLYTQKTHRYRTHEGACGRSCSPAHHTPQKNDRYGGAENKLLSQHPKVLSRTKQDVILLHAKTPVKALQTRRAREEWPPCSDQGGKRKTSKTATDKGEGRSKRATPQLTQTC